MSFARNYERKIDKMAENAIFSVYAVPIFVNQKQTYDDKYVDFSRLFQKMHKFSCVLVTGVYLDSQKSNSMRSGYHQVCIFFPNFCLERKYSSG